MKTVGGHSHLSWPTPGRWPDDWSGQPGFRVLVEDENRVWRWRAANALAEADCQVACCEGPDHEEGRGCPLVEGQGCPLAEGADAIVFGLRIRLKECRAVLERLRETGKPILMEVLDPAEARDCPPGVTLVEHKPGSSALVRTILNLATHGA